MNRFDHHTRISRLLALLALAALLPLTLDACSDAAAPPAPDAGVTADCAPPDLLVADGPAPDSAPADGAAPDHVAADAAPPDTSTSQDAGGPGTVSGTVGVSATVTCTASPATDCKGALYIGVVDKPAAPPAAKLLGSVTISGADLSGGKQIAFSITGLPAGQQLYLSAMLAEGGALPTLPYPQSGDLVVAPLTFTLKPGGGATQSLQLDARWK